MSLLKYPHSKELDPYFLPVLTEARIFMTLAAYRVLYQELQEAFEDCRRFNSTHCGRSERRLDPATLSCFQSLQ
jgi:hypothetical protein